MGVGNRERTQHVQQSHDNHACGGDSVAGHKE